MPSIKINLFGREIFSMSTEFNLSGKPDSAALIQQVLRDPVAQDSLYRQVTGIAPRPIMINGEEIRLQRKHVGFNQPQTFWQRFRKSAGL